VLWLRYVALPSVDNYRPDIVASIEKASGTTVSVQRISGGWGGLRPTLTLEGFRMADRRGRSALAIERADVTISWWSLLVGQLQFHDVDFHRPALALRRGRDGVVYLADKPLNEPGSAGDDRLVEWLLGQPRLGIHEATLAWRDEFIDAPEIQLSKVEIVMRKAHGRHHAALTAMPPAALASRIDVRGDLAFRHGEHGWLISGDGYVEALQADLAALRSHLPLPDSLRNGVGSVRVWTRLADNALRDITADLRVRDAKVQLAEDSLPLELASFSGRVSYNLQPEGFRFGTEGLRFRTPGGAEAQPGNFSVTRSAQKGQAPKGEVRADGIDLKIAASLLEYFPVPRDVKAQVLRFAPRGRIADASLTWSGEDAASAIRYEVKGRFEDLAVNAVDRWPGVSGLTGDVKGTDAGGVVRLASKGAALDLSQIFRAPVVLDKLDAQATWRRDGEAVEVAVERAQFANAHAQGEVTGTWRSVPTTPERPSPGYVDLQATVTHADIRRVGDYMPNRFEITRNWLDRSILGGEGTRVRLELKGDLYDFPFADGKEGKFVVEGDVRGARLKYHPDWPSVDAIDGTFRFEGRRMEIRAQKGAIFASRVLSASAIIENLGAKPPVLVVEGQVDTSGADGIRFLRESPLVNGPGAFSRVVAIEGPGSLKLRLTYPFSGMDPVRVAGDYDFNGAAASVGRNLEMSEMKGRLSFTEKGVSAPGLEGKMFGHPAVLRLATQPDNQVLTTLTGRIDAATIRKHLSESLGARFNGTADWSARLVSNREGSELTVTSDLKGLAVTLPEPLSKTADESRPVAVAYSRLGTENELATVNAGKGVYARYGRIAERWHAALRFSEPFASEPVREGLWLYGTLPALDADAWISIFYRRTPPAGPPPAPAGASAPDLELRGMDLRLGRVRYQNRDFTQVAVNLQKRGSVWDGSLQGPQVEGEVRWDPSGKGRVSAQLKRLAFGEGAKEIPEPADEGDSDLPALDVVADRFEFRGRWLGKLDIKAEPAGDEWRIDKLDIANDHAHFGSSGVWRRTGAGSITTLTLKLDSENLNALLGQFGYGEYMKRGSGHLEGTLVWPGMPYEFSLGRISGTFRVEGRRGQFAKLEPGAGKLLGLLSLQSLPRRATFDFSDVFSDGFAFERINGDVKVARGILLTENFEISGPSAFVTLAGEVSLPKETQSLTMRVVPEVSEAAAIAATIIGTPVLGLSTLVVSKLLKNPFGKVVAYEYQVTGSWDNPSVTRAGTPPPAPAVLPPPT
jgi:uncharacterized protein (TIGR02099 family)